jgi:two-component system chemotaxis response regulator CheY
MTHLTFSELNILLVEPSNMQRKLIMKHLLEEGVSHIDGASTGEKALEMITHYQPDLVISAMYLPDMTANELIGSIHEMQGNDEISTMLISSETNFNALEPIRQAGVLAILPKPFDHIDLQRALRATVQIIDSDELELDSYDVSELSLLVVDDSLTSRNHISRVMRSLGIENIETAENGKHAVSKLSEQHYDFIITDLNMPEMDGQELVEYIRTEMGDTLIPIMMVTTENNEARLGNVQQAGVSAILNKPFDPTVIRHMLKQVIDQ